MKRKFLLLLLIVITLSVAVYSDFVVIGDVRIQEEVRPVIPLNDIFLYNIEQINILKPDYVFVVGDLIYGYTKNKEELNYQWNGFFKTISFLNSKYYLVNGNHDTSSNEVGEEVFKKRVGELRWVKRFKNKLFIALNTEEISHVSEISDEQFLFLKNALKKYKRVKYKFVMLHKPLWWKNYDENDWFKRIHPLLKKYKVNAVFAGHFHEYEYRKIDGIEYIVTGGGGAELGDESYNGAIYHFLYAKESKNGIDFYVVSNRGLLKKDFVTPEKKERLKNYIYSLMPEIKIKREIPYEIKITNPFNSRLKFKLSYNDNNYYFTSGFNKAEFELLKGEEINIKSILRYKGFDKRRIYPIPSFTVETLDINKKTYFKRNFEFKLDDKYFIDKLTVLKPVKTKDSKLNYLFDEPEKNYDKLIELLKNNSVEIKADKFHVFNIENDLYPNSKVLSFVKFTINSEVEKELTLIFEGYPMDKILINGKLEYENTNNNKVIELTRKLKKGENEIILIFNKNRSLSTLRIMKF